ncbi:mechanosensitive ion channel family protein [Haloarchaeobius sp. HME9146]|uniref:mechanosensitive ion channel family protein n=1 Tax=Haloarchaeobius sp. HME9146 TaxID=2978732 RepID=UPI0021C11AC8|nr:mechanosensitive ion channel domain-containing protein [Haloarchaeobius sp. HME9146]MCT9095651.1 mechanosensitive ion channel [Haloarchaeobius sp. HME9146]
MFVPLQADGFPTTPGAFVDQYGPGIVDVATTVAIFLVSFAVLYVVGKYVLVRLTERSLESRGFKPGIVGLGVSIAGIIALVGALALGATVAGFGTVLVAFATLTGALVLAIGFATQDLVSNFVAGVFILKDEPFKTGDWITWDGNEGVVREISLRVTTLDTFANEMVTVPNGQLANAVLVNPVGNDTLRVSYDFGISYDDDIEQAQRIITEVARTIDGVLLDPEPSAPVADLGDSAVVLSGRVWVNPRETSAAGVRSQLVQAVKERFDMDGISMPYPHSELTGSVGITSTAPDVEAL